MVSWQRRVRPSNVKTQRHTHSIHVTLGREYRADSRPVNRPEVLPSHKRLVAHSINIVQQISVVLRRYRNVIIFFLPSPRVLADA